MVTVLGSLLGDGLRDLLDPPAQKRKGGERVLSSARLRNLIDGLAADGPQRRLAWRRRIVAVGRRRQ